MEVCIMGLVRDRVLRRGRKSAHDIITYKAIIFETDLAR